jgi:Cu2+-exporting ATPase
MHDHHHPSPGTAHAVIRQGNEKHAHRTDLSSEHDQHAGHSVTLFRDRFVVSFLLTLPILYYAEVVQRLLDYQAIVFPFSDWLPALFATVVFFFGGGVFLAGAIQELKHRQPGMMTLIAVAITAAYTYSMATTFFIPGSEFFWELATLVTIMLFGHWMEMRSVGQAQGALKELAKLLPDVAERIVGNARGARDGGNVETVPLDQLSVGDIVLVRPGAKIPADGVVIDGKSEVNESMVTGESKPVDKTEGSAVIAGTISGDGSLKIKVTRIGDETLLSGIMRLVAQAQASRSKSQVIADRAALYLTVIALLVGAATLVGWLAARTEATFALERMVTVLVIACPHALGLAVPLVTAISTSLSARSGILIRNRLALETARNIQTVIFDKTGTLTEGKQALIDVLAIERGRAKEVLRLSATVESESEHHLAKAVVEGAHVRHVPLGVVKKFTALPGQGVTGLVDRRQVAVLSPGAVERKGLAIPETLQKILTDTSRRGKTVVFVVINERVAGALILADRIRRESREAVEALKERGIKVAMLTGDAFGVAEWVADELGIDEYFAEVLPKDKASKVKELQSGGRVVAMVGDGVNDAPALAQADVGIAVGAGTDVAIESADIIIMKNDPRDVVKIINLSKATYGKMIQNLAWATGYNVVAIPLAAGAAVLLGYNLFLPPAVGALLMSASTVVVAANAQLLRRLEL